MDHEPRPTTPMEMQPGLGRVSEDLQGVLNSVSQVDGVADRAPACQLCGRRV